MKKGRFSTRCPHKGILNQKESSESSEEDPLLNEEQEEEGDCQEEEKERHALNAKEEQAPLIHIKEG